MRMEIITRSKLSVKYKVIATSVDNLEIEADKATSSNKKRKYCNLRADEQVESQETEYVGVYWNKKNKRWIANIKIDGKSKHLGSFKNDYDAAMAYDGDARKQGESVNFLINPTDVQAKKPRKLSANERIESQETEYVGVCWDKANQRWQAMIQIGKKQKWLGYFDSDYDAAIRYDEEARTQGKPVNVPIHHSDIQTKKQKKPRTLNGMERIERQETEYVGVSWNKRKQQWCTNIRIDGKMNHLGSFESEYDAAMKYDEEARKQGKAVNFKFSDEDVQAEKRKKRRKLSDIERVERQETEYVGVSWNKFKQGWDARIQIDGSRKYLGCFDSDYDAAMAYDEEARKQGESVNFPINPADVQATKKNKPRKLSADERIESNETEYVGG